VKQRIAVMLGFKELGMRRSRSLHRATAAHPQETIRTGTSGVQGKLRRRSGTRCLGLEVSTVKREAFLLVTAICTRAPQRFAAQRPWVHQKRRRLVRTMRPPRVEEMRLSDDGRDEHQGMWRVPFPPTRQ